MIMPKIAFGGGFINSRSRHVPTLGPKGEVPVYQVDVSNGMPIVSEKQVRAVRISPIKAQGQKINKK